MLTSRPLVSVIMPFYNCQYVDRAIKSVLNQTYPNIELIVVNDGSERFSELIHPFLNKIRYIEKENGGTASALNVGIEHAKGDYFAWLSSDDLFEPQKIEVQIKDMIEKNASISFTNFNTINSNGTIIHADIAPYFPTKTDFYNQFTKSCPINGCTVLMKMDVFEKLGRFNAQYHYTHDYEFWLRLVLYYEFLYINISLVNTRIHNDMGSVKHNSELLKEADSLREAYKYTLDYVINFAEDYKPILEVEKIVEDEITYKEKVSIIIPFYNCSYVDLAIQSALNQTYKNIEVIVVDDGSSLHKDKIIPFLDKIRYIEKRNGGTASALNTGIKHAKGTYFTWLSSDDLFDINKVSKQLQFMKSSNADISYTPVIYINSKNEPISGSIGIEYSNRLSFYKGLSKGCTINGCTVMAKIEIFSEVGMFDETIRYANDYDLWLRAMKKYEFKYFNQPLVMYRMHEEMGTKKHMGKISKEVEMIQKKHEKSIKELIEKEEKNI
ncbi:glycosyltransferase [Metabacillus idriensis]|uniref:glycosyltransferase n=1 Tax=Metabacillus idriensis TaxID=324768 RepID=UPI00174D82CD|nr:glycosyltransferase [Metabacillus idriensis]